MTRIIRLLGLTLISLTLTGCHVSSRTSMYGEGGRTSYNVAAQNTTNQELLLNLVRLRYSDTPFFLELNNVTTQFTYTGKFLPVVPIPGFTEENPAKLGAELAWQNQPTIQYSPLQGKDFAIQLMRPLDLRVVQGLIYTGWSVDRVFRLLIQNMADIPNASGASGPTPEEPPVYKRFFEVTKLLRFFQQKGDLQVGISRTGDKESIPNILQISFPYHGENADRLASLLEVAKKTQGKYILSMRQDFDENADLGVMTRSLLSCMYYLSLGVHVPVKDLQAGTVGITRAPDGAPFNWGDVVGDLLNVYTSFRYPENAFLAVPYRGNWFYIDDDDVNSKKTFVLLQQIYSLQAKQSDNEPPILTIPLGR